MGFVRGDRILENVEKIRDIILKELKEPRIKIPKKRLLIASNEVSFLNQWARRLVAYNIRDGEKIQFFISVGILIGIFKDLPKSGKVSKLLDQLKYDLTN